MDDDVFLLSRVRAEYLRAGDNVAAVLHGDRDQRPRVHLASCREPEHELVRT